MNTLATEDYTIFFICLIIGATYGYWLNWKNKKTSSDSNDLFLARGSLGWQCYLRLIKK